MIKLASISLLVAATVIAAATLPAQAASLNKSDCDYARKVAGGDGNTGGGYSWTSHTLETCSEQGM